MNRTFSNIIKGAVVASAMVLAIACVKDFNEEIQHDQRIGGEGERIALTIDASRLAQNGYNISFQEGDVLNINGEHCKVVTNDEGNLTVYPLEATDGIYRATYPAKASDAYWLGAQAIYIHSNMQRYAPTGFGVDAMPLMAYLDSKSGSTALSFKAMMGVLRLTIKGDAEIRSIRIKDNNLTTTVGNSCYAYAMGGYCNAMNGTTSQGAAFDDSTTHFGPNPSSTGLCPTITLICNDGEGKGVQLSSAGTTFDIVVPARAYTKGFTVSVSSNDHLNQTLKTSGSTTVNTNEITVMQPFTYSPDEDLVFAENFDALVYGSDIVTYRAAGSTTGIWRGRTPTPVSEKMTNGTVAATTADGLTPGLYFGDNTTGNNAAGTSVAVSTPGVVYSDWADVPAVTNSTYTMAGVKDAGKLFASESLLRVRNMWDWWLARGVEYDGYLSVGAGSASISKYSLGIYPRGTVMTPPFSNLAINSDVAVTFKMAIDDNSNGESIYIYPHGEGWISNVYFIDESGNEVSAGYNGKTWSASTSTYWTCAGSALSTTEWRRVKVIISGADSTTAIRFFSGGTNKTAYFIDDIEVRLHEGSQTASTTVKGKVSCNSVGIAGVVVSDGTKVTRTNSKGEYFLNTDIKTAKYVSISIPSGYEMTSRSSINGVTSAFFQKVNSSATSVQTMNFTLKEVDQSSYVLLTLADSHVLNHAGTYSAGSTNDKKYYNEKFIPFWKTYAASFDVPTYGLHLGDIVQAKWGTVLKTYTLGNYVSDTKASPIPIFHTMGNHDHEDLASNDADLTDDTQNNVRQNWYNYMGPAYYSFNIGTEHYVMIDNLFIIRGETDYRDGVDKQQLAWLKQDLALIDKSKIKGIVVGVHRPMINDYGQILSGYTEFFKLFGSWPVTVISGHSHVDHSVQTSNTASGSGASLYEFTTPSLAGTAWLTELTTDGTPRPIVKHTFSNGRPATRIFVPFDDAYQTEGENHMRVYTTSTYNPSTYGSNVAAYKITPYAGYTRYRADDITAENSDTEGYGTGKAIMVTAWGAHSVTITPVSGTSGTTYRSRVDLAYRDWHYTSLNSSDKNSINNKSNDGLGPQHQLPRVGGKHIYIYKPTSETQKVRIKAFDVNGKQIGKTMTVTAE